MASDSASVDWRFGQQSGLMIDCLGTSESLYITRTGLREHIRSDDQKVGNIAVKLMFLPGGLTSTLEQKGRLSFGFLGIFPWG